MEHAFHKLEDGENNTETFMQWFIDAKIISKAEVPKVHRYFEETGDNPDSITWVALNQVIQKLARDKGESYHYMVKYLGFDLLKKAIMTAVDTKSAKKTDSGVTRPIPS